MDYKEHDIEIEKDNIKRRKPTLTVLLAVLCAVLIISNIISLGFLGISLFKGSKNNISNTKINRIIKIIDDYYVNEIPDDLSEGIYRGLIEGLNDPYSSYMSAEEYRDFKVSQEGDYFGIGAALTQDSKTGYVMVSSVYDDSPAMKAGLREGDLLISADGVSSDEMTVSDFASIIRGERGTEVTIVYERDGEEKEIVLVRDKIKRETVTYYMIDDKVGYISISEFVEDTAKEFKEAIKELKASGMQAVIYDVRSNPGGLVDSVTEILDEILPEGTVVYMEDKKGSRKDYTSSEASKLDIPSVVLINGNSASSSEIFAGAMRDFEYATLLGTNTFGKGVVQSIIALGDGSAVRITFANYYTPKGENIHNKGIAPDVELEYEYTGDKDKEYDIKYDNQIQKALDLLEKELN